jgi:hypothetical protein
MLKHRLARYAVDAANRVLEDADNRYDWSADSQLTERTPKNGGVAWTFVSSFRARTNQMRLDAALGSVYDPFGRLVSPQWPVLPLAIPDRLFPMPRACPPASAQKACGHRAALPRRERQPALRP